MLYEKCLSCEKLGTSCKGPHFLTMSANDLVEWCRRRKALLGLTNAQIATLSEVPKGTVDRLFSADNGEAIDFKFETVRPIVKILSGNMNDVGQCHNTDDIKFLNDTVEFQNIIIDNQKETIRILEEKNDRNYKYFTKQLAARKKYIISLAVVLCLTLFLIIATLVIDLLYPELGFFWVNVN